MCTRKVTHQCYQQEPYGHNCDPGGVGSNHAGDLLGAILDLRGDLMDKISTLGGWGTITLWTPYGPFWT